MFQNHRAFNVNGEARTTFGRNDIPAPKVRVDACWNVVSRKWRMRFDPGAGRVVTEGPTIRGDEDVESGEVLRRRLHRMAVARRHRLLTGREGRSRRRLL